VSADTTMLFAALSPTRRAWIVEHRHHRGHFACFEVSSCGANWDFLFCEDIVETPLRRPARI